MIQSSYLSIKLNNIPLTGIDTGRIRIKFKLEMRTMNGTKLLFFIQIIYGFASIYFFSLNWLIGIIFSLVGLVFVIQSAEWIAKKEKEND